MESTDLFWPIEVETCSASYQHKHLHRHTYFEIIYIPYGKGVQIINNVTYNYSSGSFFIITPQDSHSFNIQETSEFISVRFIENHFRLEDNTGPYTTMVTKNMHKVINARKTVNTIAIKP